MFRNSRIHLGPWAAVFAVTLWVLASRDLACAQAQNPPQNQPQPKSSNQAQTNDSADPATRDYLSANGLLNRGMNELAVQEYRKFLQAHGNHEKATLARYGLSVALFRLKRFDEAVNELGPLAMISKFEFAPDVELMLGQCQLARQKYAEASAALKSLVAQFPEHELADDGAALLTESQYREGQFKAAVETGDLLMNRWPQSPLRERAEFFAGLARVAQDDQAGAAKAFAGILERFPKGQFADRAALLLAQSLHRGNSLDQAAAQYRAVIDHGTEDQIADAMLGLGTLLQQQNKADEAAQTFDQLIGRFPSGRQAASALVQRGRIAFEKHDTDAAWDALQRATKLEGVPADQAAYWLAKCETARGEFAPAATRLSNAQRDFPESPLQPEISYDRAVALMRAGDSPAALEALKAFRTKFPEHTLAADTLYVQAVIEHQQKHYDASRDACRAFQQKYANHPLAATVAFLAAENEFLAERMPEASEGFASFISKFPKDGQIATAKYRLGTALYRQQKFDEAQRALASVLNGKNTPEAFRRGLLLMGDISFQRDQWANAQKFLDDFLSFGLEQPSADDALLKRGLAVARQGRDDEALMDFAKLIDRFPQSVHRTQAMFERGQILLARKDFDGATQAFNVVLADGKDSRFAPHALNHLASIAMQKQDYAQAAEWYGRVSQAAAGSELEPDAIFQRGQALMAARQFQPAREAFEQLIQRAPKSNLVAQAQAQRAVAISRKGDQAEALKAIDLVQREYASALAPNTLAAIQYEKAWCLRELGRTDEAAQTYRDLIASYQKQQICANAMLELAEIEAAAKRHAEAADLLTRLRALGANGALQISPEIGEPALYRLAVSKYELGKFDETAALCEEFVKQYGASKLLPSAHLFCGEALFKVNKPQPAAAHFKVIVEQFPSDTALGPALLRLGECQATANQWADSEKTFQQYLAKFSDSELWFQAQFGVAWARENQDRRDDAIKDYRSLIERHSGPTAARAQFQIGECLFAKKQFEDAVRELLKVDILYGYAEWSAAALYEAGRCFEELSKPAEARNQFEQVQQKYPETRWAQLAAQRLASLPGRTVPGG